MSVGSRTLRRARARGYRLSPDLRGSPGRGWLGCRDARRSRWCGNGLRANRRLVSLDGRNIMAAHDWRRRRPLFDATVEALDELAQVADRVLETTHSIAHLDERDEQEDDDQPEENHSVISGARGGSATTKPAAAGGAFEDSATDKTATDPRRLRRRRRNCVKAPLGWSYRQAEV